MNKIYKFSEIISEKFNTEKRHWWYEGEKNSNKDFAYIRKNNYIVENKEVIKYENIILYESRNDFKDKEGNIKENIEILMFRNINESDILLIEKILYSEVNVPFRILLDKINRIFKYKSEDKNYELGLIGEAIFSIYLHKQKLDWIITEYSKASYDFRINKNKYDLKTSFVKNKTCEISLYQNYNKNIDYIMLTLEKGNINLKELKEILIKKCNSNNKKNNQLGIIIAKINDFLARNKTTKNIKIKIPNYSNLNLYIVKNKSIDTIYNCIYKNKAFDGKINKVTLTCNVDFFTKIDQNYFM